MNKKSIAILLVASSVASSAFATSIVDKLITKRSSATPAITKTHHTTKQANRSYTDFSGTWVGNCGNGENISTVIENSADYISFDNDQYRIGKGLQGRYQSNEDYTGYNNESFEWNKDGSALIMKSTDLMKDNIDNSSLLTDMSTFTLAIKNGQLNLDGKWVMFEDGTQATQPMSAHCTFSKKQ